MFLLCCWWLQIWRHRALIGCLGFILTLVSCLHVLSSSRKSDDSFSNRCNSSAFWLLKHLNPPRITTMFARKYAVGFKFLRQVVFEKKWRTFGYCIRLCESLQVGPKFSMVASLSRAFVLYALFPGPTATNCSLSYVVGFMFLLSVVSVKLWRELMVVVHKRTRLLQLTATTMGQNSRIMQEQSLQL